MDIDAEILVANQIQQYIKKITHRAEVGFISGYRVGSNQSTH